MGLTATNVASGATKVTRVLTAVNQEATIWCEGQTKVGISIRSVTGSPTLTFTASKDGVVWKALSVGTYPSATPPTTLVSTASAAGNFEVIVQGYAFIRVQMTTGAGPVTVILTASVDGSYQEAFSDTVQGVGIAGVLYPSTTSSSGRNTMTIPAATGRTINLTFLEAAMVGFQHGNAQLRIWDNSVDNGSPLYSCYLSPAVGSVGTTQVINLPQDAQRNVGIQPTPGNALVIDAINLGALTVILNGRVSYL